MFTLSFYHRQSTDKTVVTAPRYSVTHSGPRTDVWVYPTLSKEEKPALFCLHRDGDGSCNYHEVFVTNEEGKTIDRYRATNEIPPEPIKQD